MFVAQRFICEKSPMAKFAIAALRLFELHRGNILFVLEN